MDYDDFITIGGQILAKTGSGQYVLIPWPVQSAAETAFTPSSITDKLSGRDVAYKRLIEGGGDIVNLKGMDQEAQKAARAAADQLSPGSMSFYTHRGEKSDKIARAWSKYLSRAKQMLPAVTGFSTPIGAIASGLLYAGTSKPAGANTAIEPYEGVYATRNILDTPITPANRDLYDQAGVDTSLGPMDRDSGFDRYMQDKIQNLKNNEGIMGARTKPQAPPGQPVTGRHIGYNTGGIASLRR